MTLLAAVVKPLILGSLVSISQVLVDSLSHIQIEPEVPELLLRSTSQVLNGSSMEGKMLIFNDLHFLANDVFY